MWLYIAAWAALLVIFVVVEMATEMLTSIWFAGGALMALILALLGCGIVWQCVAFVVATTALIIATRPLVRKIVNRKTEATNADRLLNTEGIVTAEVNNLRHTGRVRANNLDWAAQSENGDLIPAGTAVRILKITGVTLIVAPTDIT